jgi:hypothetical protein
MALRGKDKRKMEASATADNFRPSLHKPAERGTGKSEMAAWLRRRDEVPWPLGRHATRGSGFHCAFMKVSPYCGTLARMVQCESGASVLRGMTKMSEALSTKDPIELLPQDQIEISNPLPTDERPDEIRAVRGGQAGNETADGMIAKQKSGETSMDSFEAARLRFFT